MIRQLYSRLPPSLKHGLKSLLSTAGHGSSWLDSVKARDHAGSKKRCDQVAVRAAEMLRLAGVASLDGKDCLEFGAGYAPSELLIYHLLGAKELWALDNSPIARFGVLRLALHASGPQAVSAALSGLADRDTIERRFDELRRLSESEFGEFLSGRITYLAPFDVRSSAIPRPFDFIGSTSVLEHIPPLDLPGVVRALAAALAPSGMMIHSIDLKDHWDMFSNPLRYLAADERFDPRRDADTRGNGLRRSDYLACFSDVAELDTRVIFERLVEPRFLPRNLSAGYRSYSNSDLLGGEVVLASTWTS